MQITINTPKWVDSVYLTSKYAIRSIKWILNPLRCDECGDVMPTKYVEVQYATSGSSYDRWGASNSPLNTNICQHCIAKAIRSGEAGTGIMGHELEEFDIADTCDRCKKETTSWKFFSTKDERVDVRILNLSWNSSHICKDCCAEIFEKGTLTTGMMSVCGGKMVNVLPMTGLFLINGRVKLFALVKGY